MVRSDVCRMHSSRVGPPNLSPYRNDSITRSIAGCCTVLRSTGAVWTITALRDQILKSELARLAEQVGADFTLLEIAPKAVSIFGQGRPICSAVTSKVEQLGKIATFFGGRWRRSP
jgi:hypothetical protein